MKSHGAVWLAWSPIGSPDFGGMIIGGVMELGSISIFIYRTMLWLFTRLPQPRNAAAEFLSDRRAEPAGRGA